MIITKKHVVMISTWAIAGLALAGCSDKKPPVAPRAPAGYVVDAPAVRVEAQAAAPKQGDSVVIAPDLRAACGIDDTTRAPRFAYDSSSLREDGREPLQKLAECLRTGPLRGKSIQLVGRADPRGTDDYNHRLGLARARSVATYLQTLGVDAGAIDTTSRGKLDATGHDEETWALDRRVDVTLASSRN